MICISNFIKAIFCSFYLLRLLSPSRTFFYCFFCMKIFFSFFMFANAFCKQIFLIISTQLHCTIYSKTFVQEFHLSAHFINWIIFFLFTAIFSYSLLLQSRRNTEWFTLLKLCTIGWKEEVVKNTFKQSKNGNNKKWHFNTFFRSSSSYVHINLAIVKINFISNCLNLKNLVRCVSISWRVIKLFSRFKIAILCRKHPSLLPKTLRELNIYFFNASQQPIHASNEWDEWEEREEKKSY